MYRYNTFNSSGTNSRGGVGVGANNTGGALKGRVGGHKRTISKSKNNPRPSRPILKNSQPINKPNLRGGGGGGSGSGNKPQNNQNHVRLLSPKRVSVTSIPSNPSSPSSPGSPGNPSNPNNSSIASVQMAWDDALNKDITKADSPNSPNSPGSPGMDKRDNRSGSKGINNSEAKSGANIRTSPNNPNNPNNHGDTSMARGNGGELEINDLTSISLGIYMYICNICIISRI